MRGVELEISVRARGSGLIALILHVVGGCCTHVICMCVCVCVCARAGGAVKRKRRRQGPTDGKIEDTEGSFYPL